jgi:hypothetical protein
MDPPILFHHRITMTAIRLCPELLQSYFMSSRHDVRTVKYSSHKLAPVVRAGFIRHTVQGVTLVSHEERDLLM